MTVPFRPQAVQAAQASGLGSVGVARPPTSGWLTALAVALALFLALFLSTAQIWRKAPLHGTLELQPALLPVVWPGPAVVRERWVEEGQGVQAGDLLFVLELDAPQRDDARQPGIDQAVHSQRGHLQDLADQQRMLSAERRLALDRRLEALALEGARLEVETALNQERAALARQTLARLQSLQGASFVSEAQVQIRQDELLALQAQGQSLARQAASLARERAGLVGERAALPAQGAAAVAQVSADLAELSRESAAWQGRRRIELRAPVDGRVHGVQADPGQTIGPGAVLAQVWPAGAALQAWLRADDAAVAHLRVGQAVRLRLTAYPYARHGHLPGRVLEIGQVPVDAQAADAAPVYRVRVALDPLPEAWSKRRLGPGQRLQADVLLERRRLIEGVLEPWARWRER